MPGDDLRPGDGSSGADRQVAQQRGGLTGIERLGGGLQLVHGPPPVTVDDSRFFVVKPVGEDDRAADPELEEVLFLPVTGPVEAEVGDLMPHGLAQLIGPRSDAGFFTQLAGCRLREALARRSAAAAERGAAWRGRGGLAADTERLLRRAGNRQAWRFACDIP